MEYSKYEELREPHLEVHVVYLGTIDTIYSFEEIASKLGTKITEEHEVKGVLTDIDGNSHLYTLREVPGSYKVAVFSSHDNIPLDELVAKISK